MSKRQVFNGFDSVELRSKVDELGRGTNRTQSSVAPPPGNGGTKAHPSGKTTESQPAKVSPTKKPSLAELLRKTVTDKDVMEMREELGQAQFSPSDIQSYVEIRWEINQLPGMPDGWPAMSWEAQSKILAPLAKKSRGIKTLVETVEQLHQNEFLLDTLNEVMEHFGVPLQTAENMVQFKNFLDEAVNNDLVETTTNPKQRPENGVILDVDLGDHTCHNEALYLPRKGSKVARDAWVVVQEKHRQVAEAWQEIESLRKEADPRLTPFKISDKDDRNGMSGKIFVMPASGNWAILLKTYNDHDCKVASIIKYIGLEEKDIPVPNCIEWNHKSHSLRNPDKADLWILISEAMENLNSRQRDRAYQEIEKGKTAFRALKELEEKIPSEPKEQGFHRILQGEEGVITICLQNFSFRKKNGKIKEGHFGIAMTCEEGMPVLVGAEASECFCFQETLVGKKFPFSWFYDQKGKIRVRVDIRTFCKENGFYGRLDESSWQSINMLSSLFARRLKREEDLAPDDYVEDEVEEIEELPEGEQLQEISQA